MKNERVKTLVDDFTKNETVVEPAVLEVEKPEPELKTGIVEANKLNVREEPVVDPYNILGEINKGEEVMIDENESFRDFYKVYTAKGLEGFCMKKYIRID